MWYYEENRIFPIKAILKQRHVLCMKSKMLFTFINTLFVPAIFKF